MNETRIRIGTRGSALAMWQAEHVGRQLTAMDPERQVSIVPIKTSGDMIQNVALSRLEGKAFFTKEIEDALLAGDVDVAVHSGKDVPTEQPDGLVLAGFLRRNSPYDAWISAGEASLSALPPGAIVGTSSLRRRALVASLRPDLDIRDLRGNVDTRLRKLAAGEYDAIVLAAAGLERLGMVDRITAVMASDAFLPAVAQGAIALEIRIGDAKAREAVLPLVDADTTAAVRAERALLRAVEGGCQVPLGALAIVDGERLSLMASLLTLDGSLRIDGREEGATADPEAVGVRLAEVLLNRGGDDILRLTRAPLAQG